MLTCKGHDSPLWQDHILGKDWQLIRRIGPLDVVHVSIEKIPLGTDLVKTTLESRIRNERMKERSKR